jgi:hypothetical protein
MYRRSDTLFRLGGPVRRLKMGESSLFADHFHATARFSAERLRRLCHAEGMARGWESKDVESQMEAREERRSAAPQQNSEEIRLAREREALMLQRTRVLADLQSAVNPGYREILQRSLSFLEEKLASLRTPGHPE